MSASNHFELDDQGRTPLHHAAAAGDMGLVREIISGLCGTGLCPQRLSLIEIKDKADQTAADVAEASGHDEIAQLLNSEWGRMTYFE